MDSIREVQAHHHHPLAFAFFCLIACERQMLLLSCWTLEQKRLQTVGLTMTLCAH